MIPSIVLVGRPNVGKSTLFNRLTRSKDALVADFPGLTRDCLRGEGKVDKRRHMIFDTGGLWLLKEGLQPSIESMIMRVIEDADAVIQICDAKTGLVSLDKEIAQLLRQKAGNFSIAVNKIDLTHAQSYLDFFELGKDQLCSISALRGTGVREMIADILDTLGASEKSHDPLQLPQVALIGKPNVGKSTLINTLAGQNRVLVSDEPGTTRDSVHVRIEKGGGYELIDTAGVRRRDKSKGMIEKLSIVKTLQAIESAQVVILLLDAQGGVHDQDAQLAGLVSKSKKSVIVALNKWDGTTRAMRSKLKNEVDFRLDFFANYPRVPISALNGSGLGELLDQVALAYNSSMAQIRTAKATEILKRAVEKQRPPLKDGFEIKLKYAHQGGKNPPRMIVYGNRTDFIPDHYRRYLAHQFEKEMHLVATPVHIEFRGNENPYAQSSKPKRHIQFKKRRSSIKPSEKEPKA